MYSCYYSRQVGTMIKMYSGVEYSFSHCRDKTSEQFLKSSHKNPHWSQNAYNLVRLNQTICPFFLSFLVSNYFSAFATHWTNSFWLNIYMFFKGDRNISAYLYRFQLPAKWSQAPGRQNHLLCHLHRNTEEDMEQRVSNGDKAFKKKYGTGNVESNKGNAVCHSTL